MNLTYCVFDLETSIHTSFNRKANPFDPRNYIVSCGFKYSDARGSVTTHLSKDKTLFPENWLQNVDVLIGQNIKFDLLYTWKRPELEAWLKAGGRIYDTMYAEYLITGQHARFEGGSGEGLSLNALAAKYGGTAKLDIIKTEYWDKGIQTIDIPAPLLLEYLQGDLDNTEIVALTQIKAYVPMGMAACVKSHMDSLLATTEMEFNGLVVDQEVAEEDLKKVLKQTEQFESDLNSQIPQNLPAELEWNWGSGGHVSALLFGGALPYKKIMPLLDAEGKPSYTKRHETGYLSVESTVVTKEQFAVMSDTQRASEIAIFKTGAKVGQYKTAKYEIQGEQKFRWETLTHSMTGLTEPREEWKTKKEGVYKTDDKVKTTLAAEGIPVAKLIRNLTKATKMLSFYRYTDKDGVEKGLLTLIQGDGKIHHSLNHVSTVTGRLSSSDPNLQNVPKKTTGDVRRMFVSRFGAEGACVEADFSQLEVHGQAYLAGDFQMKEDVTSKIDFHCKRLAAKLGEEYSDVLRKAKTESDPDHAAYAKMRTDAKVFSFQRAYGASVIKIAAETGMSVQDVQSLADGEDMLYPGVKLFNELVLEQIEASTAGNKPVSTYNAESNTFETFKVGTYISITGKRYTFVEGYAPQWLIDKKKRTNQERERKGLHPLKIRYKNFTPTQIKNYPTQGFCGELMLAVLGVLYREFIRRNNFGGKAFLINTVHDCVWVDCHKDVQKEVVQLIHNVMSGAAEILEAKYGIKVDVPFYVEIETGSNFYDMHKVKF